MEADISTKIKYIDICAIFEKLQRARGLQRKETVLRQYIDSFNKFKDEFKSTTGQKDVSKNSFYPVLRLLVPGADAVRGSYGIQITTMGKLYINMLNLPPESDDANKLKYKSSVKGCTDFADVVYSVMKIRSNEGNKSSVTLADVNTVLDTVAENDRKATELALTKFIESASPLEQKWLIRIILKKLHLGIGEQKIFSVYHPLAKEMYERHSDLLKVCESIENGEQSMLDDIVTPFKHIRPMLCGQLDLSKVEELFRDNDFYLETKMDGERFHLHLLDEKFKYFSRNGKDYTKYFGDSGTQGTLTPLVSKLLDPVVKNIILDGEMMVWDKETVSYRVKGENIDVKSLKIGSNLRPCFVAYDVLYMNGISYLDRTYSQRNTILKQIIKEQTGILAVCKRIKIDNVEHLTKCFNEALDDNEEGVVIKNENSIYKPGARNGGWYKIKPDYISGVISDFDLLIIGGYYNKTKSYIKQYLLGLYKKDSENDESPIFYSFARVGLGLSYEKRKHLNEMLAPHWISVSNNDKKLNAGHPSCIEWGSAVPNVWINPQKSTILQVRATELVATYTFRTPYTLRFPRIVSVRVDKPWNECCTLEELEIFYKNGTGVEKITKRQLNSKDFAPTPKRIKSKINNTANVYSESFNSNEIQQVSNACEGVNFCILSTSRGKPSIDELKKLLIKHGGKIVENPLSDSEKCTCIAGEITYRVKSLIETRRYDIVSIDWLIRGFTSDEYSPENAQVKPSDMIFTTASMEEEFKKRFDKYGDSFTSKVDEIELKSLFDTMNLEKLPKLLGSEIFDIEEEIYGSENIYNIFRPIHAHFYYPNDNIPKMMNLAKIVFQSRGGQIVNSKGTKYNSKVQYVFTDTIVLNIEDLDKWLAENYKKQVKTLKVLSYNWILDCDRENKNLDISRYVLAV